MALSTQISVETAGKVLNKLDGWELIVDLEDPVPVPDPFSNSNNTIPFSEVCDAWESMLSKAKLYIHNNPKVFYSELIKDFKEAVICWTASAIWKKYNHKVEAPGDELVSTDTRGKDLFFDGKSILDNLKTSKITGLSRDHRRIPGAPFGFDWIVPGEPFEYNWWEIVGY
jgi:hypothetical protein